MIFLIFTAIGGYLLGSIPTGFLVARAKGVDIRKQGSGNIGATNVFRTLGKPAGIFVFACDLLKGVAAVLMAAPLSRHHPVVWREVVQNQSGIIMHTIYFMPDVIWGIVAGVACILGHNFPVWLRFKGGKGVATSLGVVVDLAPLAAGVAFAVWAVVFLASGYVSLASIVGAVVVPATVAFTARADTKSPLLCFTCLAAVLIVLRHRVGQNIKRLLNGTENRFRKTKTIQTMSFKKIGVIGAGGWGTALSRAAERPRDPHRAVGIRGRADRAP